MSIQIGKDVVAIKSHSEGYFKKGDIFLCKRIKESACIHHPFLIDIGIEKLFMGNCKCGTCGASIKDIDFSAWFSINNFRALDDITPSIEEIIEQFNLGKI